jgi:glycerol-3-phosphate dehydrogenase (NAD(P)+)
MKLAILGNGGFGTALALVGSRAGHRVALWGHDQAYTAAIAATRRNPRYLPDAVLPPEVQVGSDPEATLAGAEAVVVAVPTQHVRAVVSALASRLPPGVPLLSLSKGLEADTALRPSEVLAAATGGRHPIVALSGPSHAEEVAAELPTAVVVAGQDAAAVQRFQDALSTPRFRIYRNPDLLGVELCGAMKNVVALAAGIADGLGFGDNTKAAILARGLVEMARFGLASGADPQTFFGLAGVGDLAVTAWSRHGRNRAFGERVGRGETVEQIQRSTPKVAEGVFTARVVRARSRQLGIEMPICAAVCGVLFEGVPARRAVAELMERDRKDEQLG